MPPWKETDGKHPKNFHVTPKQRFPCCPQSPTGASGHRRATPAAGQEDMPGVDSGLGEPPAWKQSWCQTVLFAPAFWEAELFLKHTCACSQKPLLLPPSSSFLFQRPGCSGTFGSPALDGPGKAAHFSASPWCRQRSFSKARRLWMRI